MIGIFGICFLGAAVIGGFDLRILRGSVVNYQKKVKNDLATYNAMIDEWANGLLSLKFREDEVSTQIITLVNYRGSFWLAKLICFAKEDE